MGFADLPLSERLALAIAQTKRDNKAMEGARHKRMLRDVERVLLAGVPSREIVGEYMGDLEPLDACPVCRGSGVFIEYQGSREWIR